MRVFKFLLLSFFVAQSLFAVNFKIRAKAKKAVTVGRFELVFKDDEDNEISRETILVTYGTTQFLDRTTPVGSTICRVRYNGQQEGDFDVGDLEGESLLLEANHETSSYVRIEGKL